MSLETPRPNNINNESTETPEVPQQKKSFEDLAGSFDETLPDTFNSENRGFFDKMSEGGKEIAHRMYEGLYKIPGVNVVVGKLEIAYNQFQLDGYEKDALSLKGQMDSLDLKTGALDASKKSIESAIASFREQHMPGVESLQLKLKDLDRQKTEFLGKKDTIQSKLESADNGRKLYVNKRDRIADRLISHFDETLRPIESRLEELQNSKNEAELSFAVTDAKHNEQLRTLQDLTTSTTQAQELLRKAGVSESEIKRQYQDIETILKQGREKIRAEKDAIAQKKAEINKKIADVDAEANPYRDKREQFVRVKAGRPISIDMQARTKGQNRFQEEEITAHTRISAQKERATSPVGDSAIDPILFSDADLIDNETEEKPKTVEREKGRPNISSLAFGWNKYLQEKYKRERIGHGIDQADFLKRIKLPHNYVLDLKDFKNILGSYYKVMKLPSDVFEKHIDAFLKEIGDANKK